MINAADAAQLAVHESRLNRQQSERALDATLEQFRLDQRAWVGVAGFKEPILEVHKHFIVSMRFTNTGKSPAINMRDQIVHRVLPKGINPDFRQLREQHNAGVLQPNGTFEWEDEPTTDQETGKSRPLDDITYKIITSGDQVIWVYGVMHYDDVFGVHHWTNICYKFAPDSLAYNMCSTHNDIDQEQR